MYRLLFAATLALGLASLPAPTQAAQASTRSYAPEDLRQLSTRDRVRVLETEYAEQSNGRRLPADQLDFYLAQINSGWTFSRIKADMAQSLRGNGGNPGGSWNPGNPGGSGQVFRCESIKERYRECRVDSRRRVVLQRTLSRTECIEGRTWGQRDGLVWVNWGCRGEFATTGSGWGGDSGYSGYSGYSVTCSSTHDAYRTCAWNSRYGRPRLIETLSKTECREGRNWGYRANAIWVDHGCRGRFGPR